MVQLEYKIGDCLELMKEIPDNSINAIITDPPYNIGKDHWDSIANYHSWMGEIFKEFGRILKENGTLWFFHMQFDDLMKLDLQITQNTSLKHKQLIIIDKGLQSVAGRCNTEQMRSFPRATEYLQFYTFEDLTGAEQLNDVFVAKNPMAKYLKSEFKRAGVTQKELAALFPSKNGLPTGCVSNWLLGYNFPLKEQYLKMQKYLNYEYLKKDYEYLKKDYEDLKKDYEDLKKDYEDLRYTFNLPLSTTDVWNDSFYKEQIKGHVSPKPTQLIKRIINTATNENDLICDPFLGSGTTLRACRETNRNCIGFELNPEYEPIIRKRAMLDTPDLFSFGDSKND